MNIPQVVNVTLRLALLGLTVLAVPAAHAQQPTLTIFNVNTVADLIDDNPGNGVCHTSVGSCSLRAAIMEANHSTVSGAIIINLPGGTYLLTRPPGTGSDEVDGDLDLLVPGASGQDVTISGVGAARTIVDANHLDRALDIGPGRSASVANLTIRNGNADGGGGIHVGSAELSIRDCVIENNRATNDGGGIFNGNSRLNIVRSTIRSNLASFVGGGLYLGGPTTIRDSTIYANGADNGGGMRNSDLILIVNSTISQNYANTDGGGIYNADRTFLYNSSVIDNDADHDRDENGGTGGGIYAQSSSPVAVKNTLVVNNTLFDAPIYNDCHGTLELRGFNLFGEVSGCTFSGDGNSAWRLILPDTLGALRDNGGPTLTHALLPGSNAIDTTYDQGCVDEAGALLATDQRGATRAGAGMRCDVGAFEFGAVVDLIFKNGLE